MIVIVDYNIGNVGAVQSMLSRLGKSAVISSDSKLIQSADKLILPGTGSFDSCMRSLRNTGLVDLLEQRIINDKVPLLGICVGAQMLGFASEEGSETGLGWVNMNVVRFSDDLGVRVPHMGWSKVTKASVKETPFQSLDDDSRFYFVHSYYMKPGDGTEVLLTSEHGITFAAAIRKNNIYGVQFHPEKSHRFGKKLLSSFAEW